MSNADKEEVKKHKEKIENELQNVQDAVNELGDWLDDALGAVDEMVEIEETINKSNNDNAES